MIHPKKLIIYDSIDEQEIIEVYDEELECESCDKIGSYYIENDRKIGACRRCLNTIDNYKNIRELKSGKIIEPDQVTIPECQWIRARDYQ